MAQITQELVLSPVWQSVSTGGFIGQKDQSSTVEICNADALPVGNVITHAISEGGNLQFPAPTAGTWYARVKLGSATLTFTEV